MGCPQLGTRDCRETPVSRSDRCCISSLEDPTKKLDDLDYIFFVLAVRVPIRGPIDVPSLPNWCQVSVIFSGGFNWTPMIPRGDSFSTGTLKNFPEIEHEPETKKRTDYVRKNELTKKTDLVFWLKN